MLNYMGILAEMKKICVGISSNIYTSSRPKATDSVSDFIVCSLPVSIYDRAAYGETVCRFTLYAKDISGVENYTKLSQMQDALMNKIPINNTACAIWDPVVISGGSDQSGFHALHIQCNLIIY